MPTTTTILAATKQMVNVDCRISGQNNVVVLPPISQVRTSIKFVKKIKADTSGFTVTIQPTSGDSIEGIVNGTITLVSPGDGVLLVPSPTQGWQVFAGYGPVGSGGGGGAVPPGNVTGITVTNAILDSVALTVTCTVQCVAPTDPGDTITQAFLYAEVPDQSSGPAFTVGSSPLDGTTTLLGPWQPIGAGNYPIGQLVSGITITFPAPAGLNIPRGGNISCRMYVDSASDTYQNPLVQANQSSPTPSATFSLAQEAVTTNSGTNITNYNTTTGPVAIAATALTPVNVTGKLETPVVVTVTNTPTIRGWVYRLILTYAGTDPTQAANQQVVAAGPFTQAGIVGQSLYELASADGISVPHSFAIDTPKTLVNAVVWLQAGLRQGGVSNLGHGATLSSPAGGIAWNNIVPGITPSFPITYGSTVGTTDAAAILTASITASMAIVSGLFGVATGGITNPLLGSAAVATINVQNLAITNPLLASLAVQAANLASSSVTSSAIAALAVGTGAIQTAAITNALIANLAVSGAQIQSATITGANIASATIAGANIGSATIAQANMASASIGTAQIQSLAVTDAKVNDLSASKLTAGTISATISITSPTITCTNGFSITGGSYTTTITNNQAPGVFSGIALSVADNATLSSANYAALSTTAFLLYSTGNSFILSLGVAGGVGNLTIASSSGHVSIGGNQVLASRVGSTPATLSDVIAVLQHHGLSN